MEMNDTLIEIVRGNRSVTKLSQDEYLEVASSLTAIIGELMNRPGFHDFIIKVLASFEYSGTFDNNRDNPLTATTGISTMKSYNHFFNEIIAQTPETGQMTNTNELLKIDRDLENEGKEKIDQMLKKSRLHAFEQFSDEKKGFYDNLQKREIIEDLISVGLQETIDLYDDRFLEYILLFKDASEDILDRELENLQNYPNVTPPVLT